MNNSGKLPPKEIDSLDFDLPLADLPLQPDMKDLTIDIKPQISISEQLTHKISDYRSLPPKQTKGSSAQDLADLTTTSLTLPKVPIAYNVTSRFLPSMIARIIFGFFSMIAATLGSLGRIVLYIPSKLTSYLMQRKKRAMALADLDELKMPDIK